MADTERINFVYKSKNKGIGKRRRQTDRNVEQTKRLKIMRRKRI
jgi:hypothetical protein